MSFLSSQQQVCQNGEINKEELLGAGYRVELGIDATNQRLKVLSFEGINFDLAERIKELALQKNLGKVLFNAKKDSCADLKRAGYLLEGMIPGYFKGEDAFCYSFFTDHSRAESIYLDEESNILQDVSTVNKESRQREVTLPSGFQLREVAEDDVADLVNLYKGVFASYPSPLFDPDYILKVMQKQVYFLAVFNEEGLPISAGSADMDLKNLNAEITDLATDKSARGLGLATTIISALEKEMWQRQLKCLYSLSRAGIAGVNKAFYKLGYTYHGRLLNNCHIGGRFENMNIWVKICPYNI